MGVAEAFDLATRGTGMPVVGVAVKVPQDGPCVVTRPDGLRIRIDFEPHATEEDFVRAFKAVMEVQL